MIVAVTVNFHDHQPYIQYVDTEKLNPNDYVDGEFLKAIKNDVDYCVIDASNWEDEPNKFPDDDIGLGGNIRKPTKIDKAMVLYIDFG